MFTPESAAKGYSATLYQKLLLYFEPVSHGSYLPGVNALKCYLFLLTMADQTQQVGEAQVLDENWPSQLIGFSEAVKPCHLRTLQGLLV